MFRNFLSALLVLFLIAFSLPLFIVVAGSNSFKESSFFEDDFMNLSYDFVVEKLVTQMRKGEFNILSNEEAEDIVMSLITKEDINFVIEDVLKQFDSVPSDESGVIQYEVKMAWVLGKSDEFATKITEIFYSKLPECSDLEAVFDGFDCIPSFMSEDQFKIQVDLALERDFFSNIPDEFIFDFDIGPQNRGMSFVDYGKSIVHVFYITGFGVVVLLLFSIALVVYQPIEKIMRMESYAFLGAGTLMILFAMAFSPGFLLDSFLNSAGEVDVAVLNFYEQVYDFVISKFTAKLTVYGLIILIIGIVLFMVSFIYGRKNSSLSLNA